MILKSFGVSPLLHPTSSEHPLVQSGEWWCQMRTVLEKKWGKELLFSSPLHPIPPTTALILYVCSLLSILQNNYHLDTESTEPKKTSIYGHIWSQAHPSGAAGKVYAPRAFLPVPLGLISQPALKQSPHTYPRDVPEVNTVCALFWHHFPCRGMLLIFSIWCNGKSR